VPVVFLTFGKKVTDSSVYPEPTGATYRPAVAVDGDPAGGGTFVKGLKSARLDVDLSQPRTFNKAEIHKRCHRVRALRRQAKQGGH
jgi:hypothetical protein